jgi:lipoprotein-releasing system permease protein
MNLSLFIARRYFLSKGKKKFINIISIVAMLAVAVPTIALVIVMSVFNGFNYLLTSIYTTFDPEIKIEAVRGKSFEVNGKMISSLKAIKGVGIVTEVIEDYAYLRYRDADAIVTVKGVSDSFLDQHRLDNHIVEGELKLRDSLLNYAIIGRGVQGFLSIGIKDNIYPLQVFYIKNVKGTTIDPSKLYNMKGIEPGAVFSIEKNFDENYVFLPIDFVSDLIGYGNKRTSLEIKTKTDSDVSSVQNELKKFLGEGFLVLNNAEQHKDVYKLLKLEKFFIFVSLALLTSVAAINILFSLMMLAIDKKKDISILMAMGASTNLIRRIFLNEGALISISGAFVGLAMGAVICWAQDRYGLVGMGVEHPIISCYPVKMQIGDFVSIAAVILVVTGLMSFYPARLASKSYSTELL